MWHAVLVLLHLPHRAPRIEVKCINHWDVQSKNDRAGSTIPSLLRRSISSHPGIGQVLNNIRSEDVLTELLLLDKIQCLESGARVPMFMSAPLVSLREALLSFSAREKKGRNNATGPHVTVTGNAREKGEVLGLGEVFEVLAPFDEGVVLEVLLHAQVVQVVGVGEGLDELGLALVWWS